MAEDDITLGQLEALWAATAANTKAIEELTQAIRDTHGVKKIEDAVTVVGGAAAGADTSGNPVYIAGTDGSKARGLLLDASGRPIVVGAAAENAAAAGNPIQVGGRYDSTPRTLGDGDVGALALTPEGYVKTTLTGSVTAADGAANPTNLTSVFSFPTGFNGTTHDRWRNNSAEIELLASAERTANVRSANMVNYNWRGLALLIRVTAGSGFSVTPGIQTDGVNATNIDWWVADAAIIATGFYLYLIYPEAVEITSSNIKEVAKTAIPRTWKLFMNHQNATPVTYRVSAYMLL